MPEIQEKLNLTLIKTQAEVDKIRKIGGLEKIFLPSDIETMLTVLSDGMIIVTLGP